MAISLLILCLLGLVGCTYYTYEYNAKFTLTVKTPEGIKQASSVVNARVRFRDEKHEK
jgi:hypothetical protein